MMSINLPEKTEYDKDLLKRLKKAMGSIEKSLSSAPATVQNTFEKGKALGRADDEFKAATIFVHQGTEMQDLLPAIVVGGHIFKDNPKDWDLKLTENMERLQKNLAYIEDIVSECAKLKIELSNVNLSSKDNITVDFIQKNLELQVSAEIIIENPTIGVGIYGPGGIDMEDVPNNAKALVEFVRGEIIASERSRNIDRDDTW